MNSKRPLVLVVLDGWGCRQDAPDNAVTRANPKVFYGLWRDYPHTLLQASGEAVGLPRGQMGNSEVGHLNMGAGRVVYQDITRINRDIENGDFTRNTEILKAINYALEHRSALHLIGLVSDGGVHSHINHLFALIGLAKQHGITKLYLHAFLDGRDVSPQSAATYLTAVGQFMEEQGLGKIATIAGRYYGMDRDQRWERVEKAYMTIVEGAGAKFASAAEAIAASYAEGITDEFMLPVNIVDKTGQPVGLIEEKDSIIFFNFRSDRARQITRALIEPEFKGFKRTLIPGLYFLSMTQYDATIAVPSAFPPQNLDNTLGAYLAQQSVPQLRVAETEKYAHLTFFFNGGVEVSNPLEDRILVPSPKVTTYDLQPQMSAVQITEEVLTAIRREQYPIIMVNYANPDMVGHTGVFAAAVKANQTVDACLGKLRDEILSRQGTLIITADHGNSEQMLDPETGEPHTAHTTSLVPFILVNDTYKRRKLREGGVLADVAPTLLEILAMRQPEEMTGKSLLISDSDKYL